MPVPTKLAPDITDKSHCNDNSIDNDNYGDDSNYDDDNNDDDENSEQDNDNSCTSSIMHNSDNNTLDASRCKADDNSCISDMSSLSSIKSFGKNAALDFSKIGLHGRSQETSILLDAYHRISKEGHRSQLVGIKGESGSGKSALVENMRQIVTTQDPAGWYIQGKFDPLRQMEALSAIVTAFSELCDFILHSHNFLQIRKNIQEKLGEDTSILENVIPNLFHVTSDNSMDTSTPDQLKQTSLPSSLKLASVIQAFLKAISKYSCPILIHLDDIQWADNQSQDIIQALIMDEEINNVLIVCTYRNCDKGEMVWQHICGNQDDRDGLCITEIELGNLPHDAALFMLRDLLGSTTDDVQSLCSVIMQKTASNPYFIRQFLELLQSRKLLQYSSKLSMWLFDMSKIQSETEISENVIVIVLERIAGLSSLVQGVMQLASCFGLKFDSILLEAILFSELHHSDKHSWLTSNQSLMNEYKSTDSTVSNISIRSVLSAAIKSGLIDPIGESDHFKFSHDRIQSAFYAMIPAIERDRLHYRIGTRLRQDIDAPAKDESCDQNKEATCYVKSINTILFTTVGQLNRGCAHAEGSSERIEIAILNLAAADVAMNKLTFVAASAFLRAGLNLLEADKWETQYKLTLDLFTKLAHSELYLGHFDESILAADAVISHAHTLNKNDCIKAYITKIQCLGGKGMLRETTDLCFFVLKLLGETFINPHWKRCNVMSDWCRTRWMINGKSDDDLLNLPLMEDEDKLAAMRILAFVLSYSYCIPDPIPMLMSSFRMIKLSLTYGKAPSTPLCIACYGIFTSTGGNYEKAYRYGNLSLQMQDQLTTKEFSVLTAVLVYTFARHWKHPLSDGLCPLLKTYNFAVQAGDVETTLHDRGRDYASMALHCGNVPLWVIEEEVRALTYKFAKYEGDGVEPIRIPFWLAQLLPYLQATLNLMGESENTILLTGDAMDEDTLIQEAKATDNKIATTTILSNRYFLATIFEEYDAAEECMREMESNDGRIGIRLHYVYWNMQFYRGLNSFGLYRNTKEKKYLRQARSIIKHVSKLSDLGYFNFSTMFLLLSAEERSFSEGVNEVRQAYDRAIVAAARGGCIHFEAIANEKCGAMFLNNNQPETGEIYLRRAMHLMLEWGANAKVDQMEEKYRTVLFGAPDEVNLQIGTQKRSAVSGPQSRHVRRQIHHSESNELDNVQGHYSQSGA